MQNSPHLAARKAKYRFYVVPILSEIKSGEELGISKEVEISRTQQLGLDVLSSEDDLFRWFLLCYLFGKPIQSNVAIQTWRILLDHQLDTPWAILHTKHRRLVQLLDEGKYTRYDESTARGLHTCMEQLIRDYDGSVLMIIESSTDEEELGKRLQKLHGIGPKVAEIFMRETDEFFAQRVE